mmetsp:Transcript_56581/g.130000  ORF Transcript_56581/g.130000 Transcript_56581/m.130000 type:complete len:222 (+) Transcript_56581:3-668(+)
MLETQCHGIGDFVVEEGEMGSGMHFLVIGCCVAYRQQEAMAEAQPHVLEHFWAAQAVLSRIVALADLEEVRSDVSSSVTETDQDWHRLPPPEAAHQVLPGSHFGEIAMFATVPPQRLASVRVFHGPVETLFLPRGPFREYMRNGVAPETTAHFVYICKQVDHGNLSVLGMRCPSCLFCHDSSKSCISHTPETTLPPYFVRRRHGRGAMVPQCLGEELVQGT